MFSHFWETHVRRVNTPKDAEDSEDEEIPKTPVNSPCVPCREQEGSDTD